METIIQVAVGDGGSTLQVGVLAIGVPGAVPCFALVGPPGRLPFHSASWEIVQNDEVEASVLDAAFEAATGSE